MVWISGKYSLCSGLFHHLSFCALTSYLLFFNFVLASSRLFEFYLLERCIYIVNSIGGLDLEIL